MIAGPIRCPVLIGRGDELRALVERRHAAARGRGSCVLLSGDAGMGKSRLISAFRETLTGGRAGMGIGMAREFGNAPYGPVLDALSGINAAAKLSRELSREAQLAALAAGLQTACDRRHGVLIVEDAQWADEGSLRFLLHLLPMLASMRLLLIVTHRSDGIAGGNPLATFLPRFQRDAATYRIALGPLTNASLRQILTLALGARKRLGVHTIGEIVERCEGNPFFAEELLKNALERRASGRATQNLPLSISAAVLERCATLDESTRAILLRAAILGRRFDAALLGAICARPLPRILAALHRLRDLQIIEELPGTPAAYAFRHTLTREAVYDTMLADERTPLHEGTLEALETRGAGAYDLGYHAWAAKNGAKALRYNELAGDEALSVHAYDDARLCFERALLGAGDAAVRGRLLDKAAGAAARNGKADLAARLYQMAAATFEETGDEAQAAKLYLAMSSQARVGGDTVAARAILHRAIARLPAEAAVERATLQLTLAFSHLDRGESAAAAELIAQGSAAKATPTYASVVNYAAAVRGDLPAVREASARYLRRCEAQSPEAALSARFNAGFNLCALGVDAEALATFEELLPELRERRLHALEVSTCANVALMHARAGRWEAARLAIEGALAIPESTTTAPVALAAAGLTLALAAGDEELALRCAPPEIIDVAFASRINSTLGRVAGPYARWCRARGDVDEAHDALTRAMGALAGSFGATETLLAAAELGDDATWRQALAYLDELDAMASLTLYAATAAHLRAVTARRCGDSAAAKQYATEAASRYGELGWPGHELAARALGEAGFAAAAQRTTSATKRIRAPLSAREREVAALVAQGIPNKGLAQRLAVSQRTVEKHLTSIFGKLGLRNRTELTALMVRESLAEI